MVEKVNVCKQVPAKYHVQRLKRKEKKGWENIISYHLQAGLASAGKPIFDQSDFTTLPLLCKNPETDYMKAVSKRCKSIFCAYAFDRQCTVKLQF